MGAWKRIFRNVYFQAFIVFILIAAYFSLIQFSHANLFEFDSHYHIKMAYLFRTEGLVTDMPWMYYTLYGEKFADVYLLYHLLQSPFTFFDLKVASKLSQIVFSGLALAMVFFFLRKNRINLAFFWVFVLMAFNFHFLFRFSMPRGIAVSIFFFFLSAYFLFEKRYFALLISTMLHTYAYPAFYLFLIFCFFYFAAVYLKDKKFDWKIMIFSFSGSIIGLVVNPYFPRNVFFVMYHTILTAFTQGVTAIAEWQPINLFGTMKEQPVLFVVFFLSVAYFVYSYKRQTAKSSAFFAFSCLSYFLFILHNRFVEYWAPFTVVFAAFVFDENIVAFLKRSKQLVFWAALFGLLVLSAFSIYSNSLNILQNGNWAIKENNFENCTAWLDEYTPEGAHVFIKEWSEFPALFFYSQHNYYTLGFDEYNMYFYNKTLYSKYKQMRMWNVSDPRQVLINDFNSEYVFIDNPDRVRNIYLRNIERIAESNLTDRIVMPFILNESNFEQVYADNWCGIYKVKND